ncbi:hypothetical protein B296_00008234 [Ensete ventricosum]|uniref:Uncharacterized protein n=1 Tax=Ensete ventricosum TaxID=4639 RepID=A0A426Z4A8_ENSVE|nr:hypothetical protein B296_00008234 [Ensete ventricosum]
MDRSLWFDTAMSGSAEATPFLFVRPNLSSLPPLLSSSDSIDPIDPPPSPSSNSDVGFIPLRFSSFMNNDSGRSSPESTTKKAEKNREGLTRQAFGNRQDQETESRPRAVGLAAVLPEAAAEGEGGEPTWRRAGQPEAESRREARSGEMETGHLRSEGLRQAQEEEWRRCDGWRVRAGSDHLPVTVTVHAGARNRRERERERGDDGSEQWLTDKPGGFAISCRH